MSEAPVEIVRRLYEDPRGLLAAGAEAASEDITVDFSQLYPDRPVISGIQAARRFRDQGPWAAVTFEPEKFIATGSERVLVLVRAVGTGRQSGADVQAAVAHEYVVRNGKITSLKVYADRTQALEAAGLTDDA
ncbi:MAG TPA: nuclear transport factor 2 family protein [Solirubrobacterales bacterium]|nr:nuclear transport factor 2 family protein [Solirubrobacterales bacterium]